MRKIILIFELLVLIQCTPGFSQNVYTLKNQNIEVSINGKGNLVVLKNLQTGLNYASGGPIWRMYFDRINSKDNEILAINDVPVISQKGDQIMINYNSLHIANEVLNMKIFLILTLEQDKVRFYSKIINNEKHTIIRELQYPLVANCQLPPGFKLLTTEEGGRLYPHPKSYIRSLPFSYMAPDQYYRQIRIKYPSNASSNCFALIGNDQGLYFGSHDSTFQDTWHGVRVYAGKNSGFDELEAGIYKYPNCLPGDSWSCNANVIAPYKGNWHETSKIYRAWANTWWHHKAEPLWVKEMKGFQRIIMRHQYGQTFYLYKELPTRIKQAGENAGINVVFPFGWWETGMDNGYPNYSTDPDQGGDKGFEKAIADFKKGGGKVILYYNGKLIDTESNFYKKGPGKKICLKGNNGLDITETYKFIGDGTFTGYFNSRTFVVADMKSPQWQDQLKKMADQAIAFGANSVFLDQLGYAEWTGNWDLTKEFPIPYMRVITDKANALKMIYNYIKSKNNDLALGTEHITDVTSQYVDFVHTVINMDQYNFIDWFRYTFPEIILTDRGIRDETAIKKRVNYTLLKGLRNNIEIYRLRGLIDETPEYQKYLFRINEIKEKYNQLLLLGTYRDTDGFSIDNKDIEARSFVNGDKMAIVMTQSSAPSASTEVNVPGYQYKEFAGLGENKVIQGLDNRQTIILDKDAIVVLIYQKM